MSGYGLPTMKGTDTMSETATVERDLDTELDAQEGFPAPLPMHVALARSVGYTVSKCPACHGNGVRVDAGRLHHDCPACDGWGVVKEFTDGHTATIAAGKGVAA